MRCVRHFQPFATWGIGFILVVICVASLLPLRAAAAPPVLEPEWDWEPAQGVEWIEQPHPGRSELLADTREGRLHLFDLQSGRDLLPQPIVTRPGLRPVSAAATSSGQPESSSVSTVEALEPKNLAYCFDRFTVLAIRLGPEPGLAWRVGTWCEGLAEPTPPGADPAQSFQGDPEQLRQLLAAGATPWGVMVVRDDGRFGLLNWADGLVLWERKVGPMAAARLLVRGADAALISQSGPEVQSLAIDARSGDIREYPLMPERPWPFWSGLSNCSLVLVEPERCIVATPREVQTVFRTPSGRNIIAASVALGPETSAVQFVGVLIFGTSEGVLHAIDLRSCKERWASAEVEPRGQRWSWVKLLGDLVVSAAGGSVQVRTARTGQLLTKFAGGPAARVLDASASAGRLWLLVENTRPQGAELELVGLLRPAEVALASSEAEAPRFALERSGVFLSALWPEGRLVVATHRGVSTYILPR